MFDVSAVRRQFPALQHLRDGRPPIFLDGPGGTQVPDRVIAAIGHYLRTCNANHGGAFATSRASDQILDAAHAAVARLLGAPSPEEIVFGQNMTSLTFHLTRSVARTLRPGDEVVVTRLDHDANVRPWLLAARDAGATVRWADFRPNDGTLDIDGMAQLVNARTRWVAVGAASNALGTVNDVRRVADLAHGVGARVFVDAVHYAPHGPIAVGAWDCDVLACSAYKFFGPHVGILWGRRAVLEELEAYKVRPAPDDLPGRWMTGTQNHEGIAGVLATVEYLEALGGGDIRAALSAIRAYEEGLSRRFLAGLATRPRFQLWGVADPARLAERVPTFALTLPGRSAQELAEQLAARHIYSWAGNFYALEVTERLGLEDKGGLLRLGFVHYNTFEEVDTLLTALDDL